MALLNTNNPKMIKYHPDGAMEFISFENTLSNEIIYNSIKSDVYSVFFLMVLIFD